MIAVFVGAGFVGTRLREPAAGGLRASLSRRSAEARESRGNRAACGTDGGQHAGGTRHQAAPGQGADGHEFAGPRRTPRRTLKEVPDDARDGKVAAAERDAARPTRPPLPDRRGRAGARPPGGLAIWAERPFRRPRPRQQASFVPARRCGLAAGLASSARPAPRHRRAPPAAAAPRRRRGGRRGAADPRGACSVSLPALRRRSLAGVLRSVRSRPVNSRRSRSFARERLVASAAACCRTSVAAGRAVSSGLTMRLRRLVQRDGVEGRLRRSRRREPTKPAPTNTAIIAAQPYFRTRRIRRSAADSLSGIRSGGRRRVPGLLADRPVRHRTWLRDGVEAPCRLGRSRRAGGRSAGPLRLGVAQPLVAQRAVARCGPAQPRTGSAGFAPRRLGARHLGRRLDRRRRDRCRRRTIHLDGCDQAVGLIEKFPHLAQPEPTR